MRPAPTSTPSERAGNGSTTRSIAAARKARLRRITLESLEPRTLMAVLPPVLVQNQSNLSSAAAQAAGQESSPSIAVNPLNALQAVAVWNRIGGNLGGDATQPTQGRIEGAFTTNGGVTWNAFTPQGNFLDDPTKPIPKDRPEDPQRYLPFILGRDAGVAFDRDNNFYVVHRQTGATEDIGVIVVTRYDISDPSTIQERTVPYEWGWGEPDDTPVIPAILPTVAVDSGVEFFTDPISLQTQNNKFAGNVYVSWTSLDPDRGTDGGSTIQIVGSSDGGSHFTAPVTVSDIDGSTGNTAPRLTVSQGSANVPAGQVTAVWDDFISLAGASPAQDAIKADRISGVLHQRVSGQVGPINDATLDVNSVHIPRTTLYTTTFTADSRAITFDDLNVDVSLIHAQIAELRIRLIAPSNSGLNPITLLDNRTTATGAVKVTGAAGTLANLGPLTLNGSIPGTVFDAQAQVSIVGNAGGASSTGYFRPDDPSPTPPNERPAPTVPPTPPEPSSLLTDIAGISVGLLNGTWTLEVTDFRFSNLDPDPLVTLDDQLLESWGLQFTSGLTADVDTTVATTTVRGALIGPYDTISAAAPLGIAPAPSIASDNTLGSFSPNQGRIYVTYVDRFHPSRDGGAAGNNPSDNTDIRLAFSDDGGVTWGMLSNKVNDDNALTDGFSESIVDFRNGIITGRPQYQPEVAVDQETGTLVISFLDARNDAARARVATYLATSIDGGQTFGTQTFVNTPQTAFDVITREDVVLGPIPDNAQAAITQSLGERQGLAVANGRVYPAYTSNENGGNFGRNTLDIRVAQGVIAAGPRVVASTMGQATAITVTTPNGVVTINSPTIDGTPQVDGFVVTFDRLVGIDSFGLDDLTVRYRRPGATSGTDLDLQSLNASITPLDSPAQFPSLATNFLVRFSPQTSVGTYSYSVGPQVNDLIRSAANGVGNIMDQNSNAEIGEVRDAYAAPKSTLTSPLGAPFGAPYDDVTLPLIVPGPRILDAAVPGVANTLDNLVLNAAVSAIDVTFDREMMVSSFTIADILRVMGPAGEIAGPFEIVPVSGPGQAPAPQLSLAKTFRISFPRQSYSGTYSVVLGANIASAVGDLMDVNRNAGLDGLRGTIDPITGTTIVVTTQTTTPESITAASTITSTIEVTDDFVIQDVDLRLNITFPNTPDLTAFLIAPPDINNPGGRRIRLFTGVGITGNSLADFADTRFDDSASTPIQNGGAPFRGRFNAQEPLNTLVGSSARGLYTLEISNVSTSLAGRLNNWALLLGKPLPGTGLGELVADRSTVDFRIFTTAPTSAVASSAWTPVGAASSLLGDGAGRIGGLAVDPSDPSGNTVYVAGASGGVWKTTNFLTDSPLGPVYHPLTDFGPTFGVNIGSLALFPRNNDPNQSIIFAATGEGETGSQGVGFVRSMDGGSTWTLLDSTRNADAAGVITPISSASRDHIFVGTSAFKIVVDPRPTVTGGTIVYAALSGANGGIWRSLNTGHTWQLMRAGQATDVVLDPNSGPLDAVSNPTGNLRIVYASFQGEGVFISQNQGGLFNLMTGDVGKPLFRDGDGGSSLTIPVDTLLSPEFRTPNGATPDGPKGRIILAKPDLIPSSEPNSVLRNRLYQGWLYAAVARPSGALDGLYMTKDFGRTWTRILITGLPVPGNILPTNDDIRPYLDLRDTFLDGDASFFDVAPLVVESLALDPNDPSIVYVGGSRSNVAALLRVDTTSIADPHAFYLDNDNFLFDPVNPDFGLPRVFTTSPVVLKRPTNPPANPVPLPTPTFTPFINLIQDPANPFVRDSTVLVSNTAQFGNYGTDSRWTAFERALKPDPYNNDPNDPRSAPMNGVQRAIAMRDPLTGRTRLIFGTDQGVTTTVAAGTGNQILGSIGGVQIEDTNSGNQKIINGSRNGNLQISQFYYGAAQPSQLAADISAARVRGFFYGESQDNGHLSSNTEILKNGNIRWSSPAPNSTRQSGSGVATDQTGTGTVYQFKEARNGGNQTSFFQVNGVGRTNGLFLALPPDLLPDPTAPDYVNWPLASPTYPGGRRLGNFAVNPINGDQIIISSAIGNIFATVDQGRNWLLIGQPDPAAIRPDLAGFSAQALAYGAPIPGDPTGSTSSFLYAGTVGGRIFVTSVGGGALSNSPARGWFPLSNGLDGSAIQAIITNPTRGSNEAYAVTLQGVYHMADSLALGATWRNITGDLFSELHNPFDNVNLGTDTQAGFLSAIQADWRYIIPDSFASPNGPSHPMLYVSGQGGVYRSLDDGATWRLFPDMDLNQAPREGGYLPNAHVTDLDLSLGNINPTTGRPDVATGENILLATTYGRGSFAIRLAPIVFPNTTAEPLTLRLSPTSPPPAGSDSGESSTDQYTNVTTPVISGLSEQSAFGNVVTIALYDVSNLTAAEIEEFRAGRLLLTPVPTDSGTEFTDGTGRFAVRVAAGYFTAYNPANPNAPITDGPKTFLVQATNGSGTKGNLATLDFILDTTPPATVLDDPDTPLLLEDRPDLVAASDSGFFNNDNITNINTGLNFTVVLADGEPAGTRVYLVRDSDNTIVDSESFVSSPGTPSGTSPRTILLQDSSVVADGTHFYYSYQEDLAGNKGPFSEKLTVVIDTKAPSRPAAPRLADGSDSGVLGDNITNVNQPFLTGLAESGGLVQILDVDGNIVGPGTDHASTTTPNVASTGIYIVQVNPALVNGFYPLRVRVLDVAGNVSQPSTSSLNVTILTQTIAAPTLALLSADDSGIKGDNVTNITRPRLIGTAMAGLKIQLLLVSSSVPFPGGVPIGGVIAPTGAVPIVVDNLGNFSVQFPSTLPRGTFGVRVVAADEAGSSNTSPTLTLTVIPAGDVDNPNIPSNQRPGAPTLALFSADDSGIQGDNTTVVRRPRFVGTAFYADGVTIAAGVEVELSTTNGTVQAVTTTLSDGSFTLVLPNDLSNGVITLVARMRDAAGNPSILFESLPLNLKITFVEGDANNDGKADLGSFNPTSGQFTFTNSNPPNLAIPATAPASSAAGDIPLQADFDGDGKIDYGFYRYGTGQWFVRQTSAVVAPQPFLFGRANDDLPVPADYDGDGRSDFATWRQSDGTWTIFNSKDGKISTSSFGAAGLDQPVPADYDGDGKADRAVYSKSTGLWKIAQSTAGLRETTFGTPDMDVPVPADYDGDGKADLAIYAKSLGLWKIAQSTAGLREVTFGAPELDVPVPADYDGDGKANLGVFTPTTANWSIDGVGSVVSGQPNNIPLMAPLQPYRYRVPVTPPPVTPPPVTPPPVTPPPVTPPPVTPPPGGPGTGTGTPSSAASVRAVRIVSIRLRNQAPRQRLVQVDYDGTFPPLAVQNLSNYTFRSAGRDRRFNTRDDVNLPFRSLFYNETTRTVTLTPRRKLATNQALRLIITGLAGGVPSVTFLGRPPRA